MCPPKGGGRGRGDTPGSGFVGGFLLLIVSLNIHAQGEDKGLLTSKPLNRGIQNFFPVIFMLKPRHYQIRILIASLTHLGRE